MRTRWLLGLLLLLSPIAAADGGQPDVTGTYDSNYHEVQLVQRGDRVTGTYVCCGGGTIEGRIVGRTLRYRWREPHSEGRGVWHIESHRLAGTWGSGRDDDDGGRWDLTRAQSQSQIAR